MHLTYRNVNDAFYGIVSGIDKDWYGTIPTIETNSRNGPVLQIPEPVIITYTNPKERVLFNAARDCNPFFHLFEALWMLAGRNDVAPLSYYNSKIKDYSDDGRTLNGAYGYRWRGNKSLRHDPSAVPADYTDQLDILVNHLRADPNSRRAVLQMWNVEDDLLKIGGKCLLDGEYHKSNNNDPGSRDVCCNLSVMFSLRGTGKCKSCYPEKTETTEEGYCCRCLDRNPPRKQEGGEVFVLDITVTNRSNDLIWGALGSNHVHFSFLQEYMAARIRVEVGVYNQFSNNLHVYLNNWKPREWLEAEDNWRYSPYFKKPESIKTVPLIKDPKVFEKELREFVEIHSSGIYRYENTKWSEPFFRDVAEPLLQSYHVYKSDLFVPKSLVDSIKADDWRIVARNWIERRQGRNRWKKLLSEEKLSDASDLAV